MSLSEVMPGMFGGSGDDGPNRRGEGGRRRRKKRKRRRSAVVLVVAVLVVGAAVVGSYVGLAPLAHKLMEPDDWAGAAGTTSVRVKIPEGASGRSIAAVLTSAGVVKTQQAFVDAWQKDDRASSVQPGTYQLKQHMAATGALGLLLAPGARLTTTVTVPEGMRANQVYGVLATKLKLPRSSLIRAAKSGGIGLPKAAHGHAEGYLFPATYQFEPDVTAGGALKTMVAKGVQEFRAAGVSEATMRGVVIKASIVQAEAGNVKYMGKVARVLDNRIEKHIKLQLDSTVSYAVQRFGVTTTTAERRKNSPYNTYVHGGLPAGPIGNPGLEAVRAVLHPTAGAWLFFVTTNPSTGQTEFAVDAAGHQAYVRQFQAWLRAHPNG